MMGIQWSVLSRGFTWSDFCYERIILTSALSKWDRDQFILLPETSHKIDKIHETMILKTWDFRSWSTVPSEWWETHKWGPWLPQLTAWKEFLGFKERRSVETWQTPEWEDGAECLGRLRQLESAGHSTRTDTYTERALEIYRGFLSGWYSRECWPTNACEQTTQGWGKNHSKRVKETISGACTGLGILRTPTHQRGKLHNS